MLIDVHTHLWKGIEAQCRQGILDMCDSFGIDKVLVSSLGYGILMDCGWLMTFQDNE